MVALRRREQWSRCAGSDMQLSQHAGQALACLLMAVLSARIALACECVASDLCGHDSLRCDSQEVRVHLGHRVHRGREG
eukprot:3276840-Pleurochrysis_carterae.AAC.2